VIEMTAFLLTALLAFGLTVGLHLSALRLFPRWGLLDFPERYALTRERLPYPAGIIAVCTFLILFPTFFPMGMQNVGVLLGVAMLGIVCFLDDRWSLNPWLRLGVQATVALVIFLTGTRIFSLQNPLEGFVGTDVIPLDTLTIPSSFWSNPSIWGALFTILWLGLTMNAMNWFDGIPGQVNVLSTIGFVVIGLLSLSDRVDQPPLAFLAFLLAGIAAGCLLFDLPPPKVVLGDTGSMFFGLLLGVLTIYAGGKVATAFLVLGVPLIDSVLVGAQRIFSGRSLAQGSKKGEHQIGRAHV
jgi:UDP-N-acetylmuramyl pentapeptide phosphotransferase/UDP-N-acetylglucosamine-1-phosphate transferase